MSRHEPVLLDVAPPMEETNALGNEATNTSARPRIPPSDNAFGIAVIWAENDWIRRLAMAARVLHSTHQWMPVVSAGLVVLWFTGMSPYCIGESATIPYLGILLLVTICVATMILVSNRDEAMNESLTVALHMVRHSATPPGTHEFYMGHAFGALYCGASMLVHMGIQISLIVLAASPSSPCSPFTLLASILALGFVPILLSEVCRFLVTRGEVDRACAFLDAMIYARTAAWSKAPNQPEWGVTAPFRYFTVRVLAPVAPGHEAPVAPSFF